MRRGTDIARAAAVLADGGLVAFPTETVYGLGGDASCLAAVAAIFAAKGRPTHHPLIVHLADAAALDDWAAEVPDRARDLAAHAWPGPLTMILRRGPQVLPEVTGGAVSRMFLALRTLADLAEGVKIPIPPGKEEQFRKQAIADARGALGLVGKARSAREAGE